MPVNQTSMKLLIETTLLTGFYELVTRIGGNPDTLLRQFNIEPAKVKELKGELSYRSKTNLVEEVARKLDCPDFGLRLAQEQNLTLFSLATATALNAPTVGEALESIIRHLRDHSPIRMALEQREPGDLAYLKLDLDRKLTNHRQNLEQILGVANNTLKTLCGSHFRAKSVLVRASSPLPHARYEYYFEAPVHFGCSCDAVVFNASELQKAVNRNDFQRHSLLNQYSGAAPLEEPLDLKHQVEQLILCLLPIQRCNLQTVANQLGLHKRTLQRHLSERSVVFEDFLDTIRRRLAEEYLAESSMPMAQVAALLGYREQSSFNRACRRWFDTTPMNKRKQLQRRVKSEAEPM